MWQFDLMEESNCFLVKGKLSDHHIMKLQFGNLFFYNKWFSKPASCWKIISLPVMVLADNLRTYWKFGQ